MASKANEPWSWKGGDEWKGEALSCLLVEVKKEGKKECVNGREWPARTREPFVVIDNVTDSHFAALGHVVDLA